MKPENFLFFSFFLCLLCENWPCSWGLFFHYHWKPLSCLKVHNGLSPFILHVPWTGWGIRCPSRITMKPQGTYNSAYPHSFSNRGFGRGDVELAKMVTSAPLWLMTKSGNNGVARLANSTLSLMRLLRFAFFVKCGQSKFKETMLCKEKHWNVLGDGMEAQHSMGFWKMYWSSLTGSL